MLEDTPESGSGTAHNQIASKDDHATDGAEQTDVALKGRDYYVSDIRALELNNF